MYDEINLDCSQELAGLNASFFGAGAVARRYRVAFSHDKFSLGAEFLGSPTAAEEGEATTAVEEVLEVEFVGTKLAAKLDGIDEDAFLGEEGRVLRTVRLIVAIITVLKKLL